MSSLNIDQNHASVYGINNLTVPASGAKTLPINLNFANATQYNLNLQSLMSRNYIDMVQAIFVDNSLNPSSMTITSNLTSQGVVIPAYAQAYLTLLVPNPASLSFNSTGGVNVPIELLNFPVSNAVWSVNGFAQVTASGGILIPQLVANYTATVAAGAGVTNSVSPLITPTGIGYYIAGFSVFLTSNATLTAGTDLQVSLVDSSSGTIGIVNLSPANGLFGGGIGLSNWTNKVANSTCSLNMSTSLSAGKLYYTVQYGLSNFVA